MKISKLVTLLESWLLVSIVYFNLTFVLLKQAKKSIICPIKWDDYRINIGWLFRLYITLLICLRLFMSIPLKSIKSNISMIPFKAKIMEQCGFHLVSHFRGGLASVVVKY